MKRIAILCCVSLIQASLVSAGETTRPRSAGMTAAAIATGQPGPLRKASLRPDPQNWFRPERGRSSRPFANDDQQTGNWMERHPVWAGTLIGFGAGFAISYGLAKTEERNPHAIFRGIDPGGPALVFGGMAAGLGALAGWGIGRNRDKNPAPDLGGSAPVLSSR